MISGKIISYSTSGGATDRVAPGRPLRLFVNTQVVQDTWSWLGWQEKLIGSGNGKSPVQTQNHFTVDAGMVGAELDFGIMPNHDVDLTLTLNGQNGSPMNALLSIIGIQTLDVVTAHIQAATAAAPVPVIQPTPPYNPIPPPNQQIPSPAPGTIPGTKPPASGIPSWLLPAGIALVGVILLMPMEKEKK